MSDLPKFLTIREVGPREGFQMEGSDIPTEEKVRLVDTLSDTGLRHIEVTSFVSPRWVPQMADAEEMAKSFRSKPGVSYTALYLNQQGFERARATGKFNLFGHLGVAASEAFSKQNTNRTIEEALATLPERIERYMELGLPIQAGIMTAFGCNFQGEVSLEQVLRLVQIFSNLSVEGGFALEELSLADTMGWANPLQVRRVIGALRERWPVLKLSLHLHDTRGTGLANAYAALDMGIDILDSSIGGMGGCPFAGHQGAAGNICTEDIAFLAHEMGIETGLDQEKLIESGRLAEEIVGHPLPGKVMKGGSLAQYRSL